MLRLEQVEKSFDSLRAVDGVSLTVDQGQIIGLIGPNGSGKSTLLNLIGGTLTPDAGQIYFAGEDVTQQPVDAIFQRGLARSFQDPSLFFRMSVLDNMLLPVKEQEGERPARAPWHRLWRRQERANAEVALDGLAATQLSNHVLNLASDLSGGQMKLVELARSLMGAPRMLLLDEPTAGVAPKLAYEIFDQIQALRAQQNLTFLIVEHRLEILFDYVDSVYVMHMGKVIAQGTPEEIQDNAEVREVYFGI